MWIGPASSTGAASSSSKESKGSKKEKQPKSHETAWEAAIKYKKLGNDLFQKSGHSPAVNAYTTALEHMDGFDRDKSLSKDRREEFEKMMCQCLNNRAQVQNHYNGSLIKCLSSECGMGRRPSSVRPHARLRFADFALLFGDGVSEVWVKRRTCNSLLLPRLYEKLSLAK